MSDKKFKILFTPGKWSLGWQIVGVILLFLFVGGLGVLFAFISVEGLSNSVWALGG